MKLDVSQVIGHGRSAGICEWDNGCVLKLYKESWPAEYAVREAETLAKVHAAGLRVPFVHGIVMERITGNILGNEFLSKPWHTNRYACHHRLVYCRPRPSSRRRGTNLDAPKAGNLAV